MKSQHSLMCLSLFMVTSLCVKETIVQRGAPAPMQPLVSECDTRTDTYTAGGGTVKTKSQSCMSISGNTLTGSSESRITSCPAGWNSLSHSVTLYMCRTIGLTCLTDTVT